MIKVKTTDDHVQTTLEGESYLLLNELAAATATLMQILIEDCDATAEEAEREIKNSCMIGICFTEHRLKHKTK